jgi:hypothetical protein
MSAVVNEARCVRREKKVRKRMIDLFFARRQNAIVLCLCGLLLCRWFGL